MLCIYFFEVPVFVFGILIYEHLNCFGQRVCDAVPSVNCSLDSSNNELDVPSTKMTFSRNTLINLDNRNYFQLTILSSFMFL